MKKMTLIIGSIAILLLLVVATFNITYCFTEYGKNIEINFETNGGNKLDKINYVYEYGNILIKMPTPQKTGYSFKGWYLDKNFETKLLEMPIPQFKDNSVTLYAKWDVKTEENSSYLFAVALTGIVATISTLLLFKNKKETAS